MTERFSVLGKCDRCGAPLLNAHRCAPEARSQTDIVERLRQRLITVPKPGAKPFDPPPYMIWTSTLGAEHKAGDPAGYSSININANVCSSAPSVFKMLEMIYAVDPLCEDAAKEIERLRDEYFAGDEHGC